ncbi:MAG: hypothetical protein DI539_13895 [Flavobacterium psychrophilum]|nr:MAG: hypothetical protein DI539_13895 [Flavobacterium psychrophilum]
MKKLLFIPALALMLSCSGDDSNESTNQSKNYFNPPTWIQGNWKHDNSDAIPDYRFTSDDFIDLDNGEPLLSYKKQFETLEKAGQKIQVTENISETKYYVQTNIGINFHFDKIASNKIKYTEDQNMTLVKVQ